MVRKLKKCCVCSRYTMKEECCDKKTRTAHPPKFSPEDKWARYRRKLLCGD
ncbi:MAG: nucleolar RNA-binding Nop10p family protein [Candidatus Micrarchaeia archaeon]